MLFGKKKHWLINRISNLLASLIGCYKMFELVGKFHARSASLANQKCLLLFAKVNSERSIQVRSSRSQERRWKPQQHLGLCKTTQHPPPLEEFSRPTKCVVLQAPISQPSTFKASSALLRLIWAPLVCIVSHLFCSVSCSPC